MALAFVAKVGSSYRADQTNLKLGTETIQGQPYFLEIAPLKQAF